MGEWIWRQFLLYDPASMKPDIVQRLEQRLGRQYVRQRLALEDDHHSRLKGRRLDFFHPEGWYSVHTLIRNTLKITGLYARGRKNAACVELRHNRVSLSGLPPAFEGFTLLHISDMHVDMSHEAMSCLIERVRDIDYDLCVLTGDYCGNDFGARDSVLREMARVCRHLRGQVFGVLGNHDSLRLVPGLEDLGIRMLLNESVAIERRGERIHLAGIDDAHYFRVHNLARACADVPAEGCALLLSHTPEIYRLAACAGFKLLLCGHTHGGQVCLPGRLPITLDARVPRHMGAGAWKFADLIGYTSVGAGASVVPVRFNCPPEITLHRLGAA